MEPRGSTTAPTGSSIGCAPPITVRRIPASQTYALRHAVLWPDKPMAYVQLPDDETGQHFGAFLLDSSSSSNVNNSDDEVTANTNANTASASTDDPEQDNANNADINNAKDNPSPSLNPSTDEPISVISLFIDEEERVGESSSSGSRTKTARVRKFATATAWQRRGVGSAVLGRAVEAAASSGATSLWCDARASALPFYGRFGMRGEGQAFFKGDVAYLRMVRGLP